MTLLWNEMDKAMVNHGESQILDAVMRLQLSEVSEHRTHLPGCFAELDQDPKGPT